MVLVQGRPDVLVRGNPTETIDEIIEEVEGSRKN